MVEQDVGDKEFSNGWTHNLAAEEFQMPRSFVRVLSGTIVPEISELSFCNFQLVQTRSNYVRTYFISINSIKFQLTNKTVDQIAISTVSYVEIF